MALNVRLAKVQGSRERRELEERLGLAREFLFTPTDDEVLQQVNENAIKFEQRKIAEMEAAGKEIPEAYRNQDLKYIK
ncbi:hypothetical protein KY332_01605 [Candidatus Woesearchaeota archaeon]|nr:hypothetical protein [Candidatus Woesearchaeota archaeon]